MIIYPSNIDSLISKKQGRKISKKHAVQSPTSKELLKALKILGEEDVRLEPETSYPRNPSGHEGRVVSERKEGKLLLMKKVSKEIKRMRTLS